MRPVTARLQNIPFPAGADRDEKNQPWSEDTRELPYPRNRHFPRKSTDERLVGMADFNLAIVKTLAREGGAKVTEDPTDKGGLTKYGISQRSYPLLNIRALTEDQARKIYKADFWDKVRGDEIKAQAVAESIFDSAVNMGVTTAARLAQFSIGIPNPDGVIGPKSILELNAITEHEFLGNFALGKIARYVNICMKDRTQERFLLGWIRRALEGSAA
jgi:lysozyme family protein